MKGNGKSGMYIENEPELKGNILKILDKLQCYDAYYRPTDDSKDMVANSIILLIATIIRNERLGIKQ